MKAYRYISRLLARFVELFRICFGRRNQYRQNLVMGRIVGEKDVPGGKLDLHWYSVSRHGLLRRGITCPGCGTLAARISQWEMVHVTPFGEAVHCFECKSVLLASPDDDIDPVKPGKKYDEEVYHTFAKADDYKRPIQRTTTETVKVTDWVVINNPQSPYYRAEGRVVGENADQVCIALAGNHGMGAAGSEPAISIGGNVQWLGRANVAVMVLPTLRVGDLVRVTRGKGAGSEGKIVEAAHDRISIAVGEGKSLETIPERIEKVLPYERA
jgi:hypothetical protein